MLSYLFLDLQADRRSTAAQSFRHNLAGQPMEKEMRDRSTGQGLGLFGPPAISSLRPQMRLDAWPLRYVCRVECEVQGELR